MPLLHPSRRRASYLRGLAAASVAASFLLTVTACSPQRSVTNYCSAVKQHKDRYLSAMQAASGQGFGGLITSAAAIGDLQTMWSDLANVAPDDIRTDTETVRDAWSEVQDDAGDHKLLAAAATALSAAPAMSRVNTYIAQHCGADAAPVGTLRTPTAAPVPSDEPSSTPSDAPADTTPAGSVLVSIPSSNHSGWDAGPSSIVSAATSSSDDSLLDVSISSVSGGAAATSQQTFSPTSSGELPEWAIGTQHDVSAPLSLAFARIVHTDASGLNPETWAGTIASQDAGSAQPGTWYPIPHCTTEDCSLKTVKRFGDVAVLEYVPDGTSDSTETVVGIDLTSGHVVWTRPQAEIDAVSDEQVLLHDQSDQGQSEFALTGVVAASGRTAWTFKDTAGDRADDDPLQLSDRLAVIPSTNADDDASRLSLVDLASGHVLATRWGSGTAGWAYDPVDERVVVAGTSRSVGAEADLTVLSATTGQVIYAISPDHFQKLGTPQVAGAYAGRAWITTTSGLDEVDTQTGAQSPDSPQLSTDGSTDGLMLPDRTDRAVMHLSLASGTGSDEWYLLNGAGNPSYQGLIALRTPQ